MHKVLFLQSKKIRIILFSIAAVTLSVFFSLNQLPGQQTTPVSAVVAEDCAEGDIFIEPSEENRGQGYCQGPTACADKGYDYDAATGGCSSNSLGIPKVNIYTEASPKDQVMMHVYTRMIAYCMYVDSSQYISRSEATDTNKWWPQGAGLNYYAVSALVNTADDGKLDCSNEEGWIDTALALLKFTDKVTALCTFGYYRSGTDGSYDKCVNGSGGDFNPPSDSDINKIYDRLYLARNISRKLLAKETTTTNYTSDKDEEGSVLRYTFYSLVFNAKKTGCSAQRVGSILSSDKETISGDRKALIDSGEAAVVPVVVVGADKTTSIEWGVYQWKKDGSNDILIANMANSAPLIISAGGGLVASPNNPQRNANSCKEIASYINSYYTGYKTWADKNIDAAIENGIKITEPAVSDDGTLTPTCNIEGVGWIICPMFKFLANVSDGAYAFIAQLLETDAEIVSRDSATYDAWSFMRTFANVGFVIAFLIIIFSQLTGAAISNYGIKKMLPRLMIAALLVNLSFFVTQLAVDISNILGSSLKTLIESAITFRSGSSDSILDTGSAFSDIAVGVFSAQIAGSALVGAGIAIAYAGPSLLIPIVLAGLLAIIVTLFVLIARQALIVLFVVISPLAFLAMLLPNTENLFKQWRKIFISLLIIYPAIAVLFGASKLASSVLLQAFGGDIIAQLIALAVMVLPLFAIPSLLKGSLNAVPGIGKLASNLAGKANGLIGKQTKSGFNRSTFGQTMAMRRKEKESFRMKGFAKRASVSGSLASILAKEPGITPAQRYANSTIDRNMALMTENHRNEDIKAATVKLAGMNLDQAGVRAIARGQGIGKDRAMQAAAIQQAVASNDVRGMNELWDASHSEGWDEQARQTLASSLSGASGRPSYFSMGAIAKLRQGKHQGTKDTAVEAVRSGAYSPAKIAAADKDELHAVSSFVNSHEDKTVLDAHQKLINDTDAALKDADLLKTMGKNLDRAKAIVTGQVPTDKLS